MNDLQNKQSFVQSKSVKVRQSGSNHFETIFLCKNQPPCFRLRSAKRSYGGLTQTGGFGFIVKARCSNQSSQPGFATGFAPT
jgi:hypothetical protein